MLNHPSLISPALVMTHTASKERTSLVPKLESSPCLKGERIAFTGILASMTHAQAFELTLQNGGTPSEHVSKQTTMLVVGDEGWPLEDDGQPSVKLQQAERLQATGLEVQVIHESQWLTLLGLTPNEDQQLYTPAMLSSILGISVYVIRGWARAGLIQPVRKVFRLPYFDFREVSSARRLSELLSLGVERKEIEQSLRRLPSVLRGDERPLEQLQILAHRLGVIVRDSIGLKLPKSGQRVFDFEHSEQPVDSCHESKSDLETINLAAFRELRNQPAASDVPAKVDWLVEGCKLYDSGEVNEALEAFRMAAMTTPNNSDVHFQMGECLYRLGNSAAALERYYVSVEQDNEFLEAWTQIGCLHREVNDLEAARMAFLVALDIFPEYPDAHFHLAETLRDLGDIETARQHWQEYLTFDSRGPWADIARQRLK